MLGEEPTLRERARARIKRRKELGLPPGAPLPEDPEPVVLDREPLRTLAKLAKPTEQADKPAKPKPRKASSKKREPKALDKVQSGGRNPKKLRAKDVLIKKTPPKPNECPNGHGREHIEFWAPDPDRWVCHVCQRVFGWLDEPSA